MVYYVGVLALALVAGQFTHDLYQQITMLLAALTMGEHVYPWLVKQLGGDRD